MLTKMALVPNDNPFRDYFAVARIFSDEESTQIKKVGEFATKSHEGQVRKYKTDPLFPNGVPYITHPVSVYNRFIEWLSDLSKYGNYDILMNWAGSNGQHNTIVFTMAQAALLHDVIEDCSDITPQHIEELAGEDVVDLVLELTNASKGSTQPRAWRKSADREQIKNASYPARLLKLLDRLDNVYDMKECDTKFLMLYCDESLALAEVLTNTDPKLAMEIINVCHGYKFCPPKDCKIEDII